MKLFNILFLVLILTFPSYSQVNMTIDQALEKYFPGLDIKKEKVYLTKKLVKDLTEKAESRFQSRVFTYYEAASGSNRKFTAFVITHKLRTRTQTLFIVFDNGGRMKSSEVIAFYEPEEYIMSGSWFKQFYNKTLPAQMPKYNEIIRVANSTISYNETTKAIKRVANLYSLIYN